MIKFNLKCECESIFESWFSSSEEYSTLVKKKLVNCIYCNSTNISKSLMTPNLKSKSNKSIDKSEKNHARKRANFGHFSAYNPNYRELSIR